MTYGDLVARHLSILRLAMRIEQYGGLNGILTENCFNVAISPQDSSDRRH